MKYSLLLFFIASLLFVSCKSEKDKAYQNILSLEKEYHAKPDIEKAKLLDSAYKSYTAANPRDTATPKFLYEDAKLHTGILNAPLQAVSIYKQIFTDYPDDNLAPEVLFLYGYFHEQLGNQGEARKSYEMLLAKYPKSEWADDAKGSLNILGKDLNEVIKGFDQKDSAQVQ